VATIRIRDVPEDVHRTYRRRAEAAGQSLQEFLLAEVVEGARAPTPAEVVAEVQGHLERSAGEGFSPSSSADCEPGLVSASVVG
jgi:plasmid stability protein